MAENFIVMWSCWEMAYHCKANVQNLSSHEEKRHLENELLLLILRCLLPHPHPSVPSAFCRFYETKVTEEIRCQRP